MYEDPKDSLTFLEFFFLKSWGGSQGLLHVIFKILHQNLFTGQRPPVFVRNFGKNSFAQSKEQFKYAIYVHI